MMLLMRRLCLIAYWVIYECILAKQRGSTVDRLEPPEGQQLAQELQHPDDSATEHDEA